MAKLQQALERSRQMIAEALAEARAELQALRAREAVLEAEIAQAEAVLGEPSTDAKGLTLHEALAVVLEEAGEDGLTARELAASVTERGLYRKRDGGPVEANQIHARANNYPDVFEKDGPRIRLRKESLMLSALPSGIALFRDDDEGFFGWLGSTPDGFFINTERMPNPNYLVLHRPQCPHFKGGDSLHWTKDYIKLCGTDRESLERWSTETVGGDITLCGSCFG
jgi:hypothetical protein